MSQLAGFAKAADLSFFLRSIVGATYEHDTRLSPSEELLAAYRGKEVSWGDYEPRFLELMEERGVPEIIERAPYEAAKTVLLCSEATAEHCHRRLVAELLRDAWGAKVEHL